MSFFCYRFPVVPLHMKTWFLIFFNVNSNQLPARRLDNGNIYRAAASAFVHRPHHCHGDRRRLLHRRSRCHRVDPSRERIVMIDTLPLLDYCVNTRYFATIIYEHTFGPGWPGGHLFSRGGWAPQLHLFWVCVAEPTKFDLSLSVSIGEVALFLPFESLFSMGIS